MLYITGITGHSGRFFLEKLEKENYKGKIKCVIRKSSDSDFLNHSNLDIETVVGDLEDLHFLTETMKGVSNVLHISGIFWTENVVRAAISNNVKWVVCVHTTGRFSKYKSASEEYIRIEDEILKRRNMIDITVLRPTMIYGSSRDQNMYKLVDYLFRHKFFPMFGKGKNLMQPVHANDLANAYYNVLERFPITKNKEYNLSGKAPIYYIDIIRTVSKELGKKTVVVKLPLWFSIEAAKVYNFISKKALISVEQVLRMQEDKDFSYKEASNDFNYNPVAFEEGIKNEVKEYISSLKRGK